jgi:prepilin-type N-terminal cleavage/methylation domain-containing protein
MGILFFVICAVLLHVLTPMLIFPSPWAEVKKKPGLFLDECKQGISDYIWRKRKEGFTLIELAIVLVIIGLIVGGVLVGRDMIGAAAVRATITQIEQFNTAANTFQLKYNGLPGDIPAAAASAAGLPPRGLYGGQGDGNGRLEGNNFNSGIGENEVFSAGETVMFWVDLSAAQLIEGTFNTASSTVAASYSGADVGLYLPQAKVGQGNYFYVYGGGNSANHNPLGYQYNFFGLSGVTQVGNVNSCGGCMASTPALTVSQALAIDTKIDDGLPQSGTVTAQYMNATLSATGLGSVWAAGGGVMGASAGDIGNSVPFGPTTSATSPSSTTCYANGGVNGATQQYSVTSDGTTNLNCALSIVMQGAAR